MEEERREKRNRMKEKKDDFRRLMEDAKLNGKSTFSDFAHRYGKDERFRGVEKTRERESLFNEFIVEIRRQEKDERDAQREKVRIQSNLLNGPCQYQFLFFFKFPHYYFVQSFSNVGRVCFLFKIFRHMS